MRWTCAFDVRGGADRPGWGEIRRRIRATLERHASVERAPHDAVLALDAGLSAAVGARWAKTGTFHSDGHGD